MKQTEREILEKERDRLARRIPRLEAKLARVKEEYEEALDDVENELTLTRRQYDDLVAAVGKSKKPVRAVA